MCAYGNYIICVCMFQVKKSVIDVGVSAYSQLQGRKLMPLILIKQKNLCVECDYVITIVQFLMNIDISIGISFKLLVHHYDN